MEITNRSYIRTIIGSVISYSGMSFDCALIKLIDCCDDYVLENFLLSLLKSVVIERS